MAEHPIGVRIVVRRNELPALPAEIRAQVAGAVARAASDVEAGAKANAPVRTGTLRRSIHTELSSDGLRAVVGPSVEYGKHVEFGTRFVAARPYLRPAFERVAPRLVDIVKALLRRTGR